VSDIVSLAKALPFDTCIEYDKLVDEWKLLQLQEYPAEYNRIDTYWNDCLIKANMGSSVLSKVIHAALSVSHGNTDVERTFSASGLYLTDDRAGMSEIVNAVLTVKDALKLYNNTSYFVPITKELLVLAQSAHSR